MLIDTKSNPFGAAVTPHEKVQGPVGVMIDAPQNVPMPQEEGMVEQGVGILKGKATDMAVNKATGAATTMAEKALMGSAGKGGATTGAMVAGPAGMPVAAGAAKTGLMAAAPMAAPLVIGGLIASKLLK